LIIESIENLGSELEHAGCGTAAQARGINRSTCWRSTGRDLRGEPIERRKEAIHQLLGQDHAGLLTSHPIAAADVAFKHICQLGLEGIVSKKLGSYESGRSSLWLKTINPNAPALHAYAAAVPV
jgi:hypothetical protein